MRWWLGSLPTTTLMAWDEFVVGDFRVRLEGNSLELLFEGSGTPSPDNALALANRYVEALNRRLVPQLQLMTEEEFIARTTQLFPLRPVGETVAYSRERRERTFRAVDEARNELLANADPALQRVYGYLRRAREQDGRFRENAILDLYKAVETIENALGGEAEAGQILGCLQAIKALKRVANERTADERHAPTDPAATPVRADIGRAFENTLAVVRPYEAYLMRGGRPSSTS